MKKVVIFLSVLALIASSCGQATKKQGKDDNTESEVSIENTENIFDNDVFGNRKNPLYGKIYRDVTDIPELKVSIDYGGLVISADSRYGMSYFMDDKENIVAIFNEFTKPDENGRVKYIILDTVQIGKLKDKEYIMLECKQDNTIWDSEIIAVFLVEDDNDFYNKEIFDNVVKAWRMDTKTGKIKLIENLEGLISINEALGV